MRYTNLKTPLPTETAAAKPTKAFLGWDTPGAYKVSYTPAPGGLFNIYLYGAIEDSRQFMDAIEVFQLASEQDIVVVNLSSPGGSIDATDTFLQAYHECRARVIIKATGGCHSAASIIMMHAREFTLSAGFSMLIHNGYCGGYDKYSDWQAHGDFTKAYMADTMRRTYEGFLTDDEMDAMLGGKDMWLGPKEFMERWKKREAFFEAHGRTEEEIFEQLDD